MLPKAIEALREVRITLISGGWRHTMAADDTGQLHGWGWNRVCHVRASRSRRIQGPELSLSFVQLSACSWPHACALAHANKTSGVRRSQPGWSAPGKGMPAVCAVTEAPREQFGSLVMLQPRHGMHSYLLAVFST